MTLPVADDFEPTTITVATKVKPKPNGTAYAAAVSRSVFVEDGRKLVRAANGEQIVSETTLYDTVDQIDIYTDGSKVTVNGRDTWVITAKRRIIGDPDVDHAEIALA